MVLYARFIAVDHGTHSDYRPDLNGTYGYGVPCWNDPNSQVDWMVFDNETDALLYDELTREGDET